MIKQCEVCGREFVAQRSTAKYCSNRCRLIYQRGGTFTGQLEVPDTTASAHCTAADLSRASMHTPAPLCLSLKAVARKLEGALRGEGL